MSFQFFHIFSVDKKNSYIAHTCSEPFHYEIFHVLSDTSWTKQALLFTGKGSTPSNACQYKSLSMLRFYSPFWMSVSYWREAFCLFTVFLPRGIFQVFEKSLCVLTAFSHCLHTQHLTCVCPVLEKHCVLKAFPQCLHMLGFSSLSPFMYFPMMFYTKNFPSLWHRDFPQCEFCYVLDYDCMY